MSDFRVEEIDAALENSKFIRRWHWKVYLPDGLLAKPPTVSISGTRMTFLDKSGKPLDTYDYGSEDASVAGVHLTPEQIQDLIEEKNVFGVFISKKKKGRVPGTILSIKKASISTEVSPENKLNRPQSSLYPISDFYYTQQCETHQRLSQEQEHLASLITSLRTPKRERQENDFKEGGKSGDKDNESFDEEGGGEEEAKDEKDEKRSKTVKAPINNKSKRVKRTIPKNNDDKEDLNETNEQLFVKEEGEDDKTGSGEGEKRDIAMLLQSIANCIERSKLNLSSESTQQDQDEKLTKVVHALQNRDGNIVDDFLLVRTFPGDDLDTSGAIECQRLFTSCSTATKLRRNISLCFPSSETLLSRYRSLPETTWENTNVDSSTAEQLNPLAPVPSTRSVSEGTEKENGEESKSDVVRKQSQWRQKVGQAYVEYLKENHHSSLGIKFLDFAYQKLCDDSHQKKPNQTIKVEKFLSLLPAFSPSNRQFIWSQLIWKKNLRTFFQNLNSDDKILSKKEEPTDS